MKTNLEQIKEDLAEIKACLIGSMGTKGLARRVEELEESRESVRAKVNAIMWMLPAVGAAILAVLGLK